MTNNLYYEVNATLQTSTHNGLASEFVGPHERYPKGTSLIANLPNLVLAFSALTSPIVYNNYVTELRRCVTAPIAWNETQKPGIRISLDEARKLAFQIQEKRVRGLREERSAEATFLLGAWEDDEENEASTLR